MSLLITGTGPTSLRTFTFPDANATILTTNTAVTAAQGGTGIASYTVGDLLYASGASALSALAGVATGNALLSGGLATAPAWGKVGLTTHVSGILPTANGGTGIAFFTAAGPTVARVYTFPDAACSVLTTNTAVTVAQGGTGLATLTAHAVYVGNGASAPTAIAVGATGTVLVGNTGADPSWSASPTLTSVTAGTLTSTGNIYAAASGAFGWNGGSISSILAPSDGVIRLGNAAATDFSRLQFGGTTASFPALKRNSNFFDVRLADDSGFTAVRASGFIASTDAYTGPGTAATTGDWRAQSGFTFKARNAAGLADFVVLSTNASDQVVLSDGTADIKWNKALVALGAGAAPTLGTIGGSGPATAAQNTWMRIIDSTGAAFFVPAWK